MTNELLLILSIVIIYGSVLLFYKLFKTAGLFCWMAFATVVANIEVVILVDAFGIEQTLGNVLFASTFVVTDILSETVGKKQSTKAVWLGFSVSAVFILLSQIWTFFIPSANDFAHPSIVTIFKNTPRLMAASLAVFAISQLFDVFLYHAIWKKTTAITGDSKKLLWVRNNAATLLSQLLNAICYNLLAFGGIYGSKTLVSIIIGSFAIAVVTSLCDTPVIYIARRIYQNENK